MKAEGGPRYSSIEVPSIIGAVTGMGSTCVAPCMIGQQMIYGLSMWNMIYHTTNCTMHKWWTNAGEETEPCLAGLDRRGVAARLCKRCIPICSIALPQNFQ